MICEDIGSVEFIFPDKVLEDEKYNYYISYDSDKNSLMGEHTALVTADMRIFYMLNGDHRDAYKNLIERDYESCLEYFKANYKDVNKYGNKLKERNGMLEWIRTKDKLPEMGKKVPVYKRFNDGSGTLDVMSYVTTLFGKIYFGYLIDEPGEPPIVRMNDYDEDILLWMDIPEIPKGE